MSEYDTEIEFEGPALTGVYTHGTHQIHFSSDSVIALPCGSWPSSADGWVSRYRPASWPSKELVEKVMRENIYIVPKCHSKSKHGPTEWRFSFSLSESRLARSLNSSQRQAYLFFKLIQTVYMRRRHREQLD